MLKTLFFVIIYAILHVVVICLAGPVVTYYQIGSFGQMYNRIKDIPNHKNPDILFIGSSHAYRGFDTRVFEKAGITSFNLGSLAQTPMQTEVLFKKYLDVIAPKSIIFEVYPILFQNDGVESTADLISNDHIDAEICKLAFKSGNIRLINTLIYGVYQEYFRGIRSKFQEKTVIRNDKYISGGYVEKLVSSAYVEKNSASPIEIEINPKQLQAFNNCITMVQDRQIPFLMVKAPLPKSTNSNLENLEEFNEVINSYGTYLDFNELMQLEDTCFFDFHHLRQQGVELFNERLIQVMDSLQFGD